MPIYTYECPNGHRVETQRRIADRRDPLECDDCGENATITITPVNFENVMGAADFPGYHCPVTGGFVDSRVKRKEIMKRHGLEEAGDDSPARRKRLEKFNAQQGSQA